jgi:HK97 family phage major capsid protein
MTPTPERRTPAPGQRITRELRLTERAIDLEARTVDLAFASETPVERWYGYEILQCKPENVRLARINNAGALLCNHEWDEQIGVVVNAAVAPDGRCRATVKFSRAAAAEEFFQDVIDGIRQLVSVGYLIHAVEERTEANVTTYTITDWEPYEISLVSVPADVTVGVGRSLPPTEVKLMSDKPENTGAPEPTPAPVIDIARHQTDARQAERQRCARLTALAQRFGHADVAARMIADGSPESAFIDHLAAERDRQPPPKLITDLDMPKRERAQYSILRACDAYLKRDWSKAGLELEASRTISDKLGREARGFFVPMDIQLLAARTALSQRAMMVGDDTAGGYLVGESDLGLFIEALRANSVLMTLGATVLDGLVGDVSIPRVNTSATFYWLNEDAAPTASEMTIGAVNLRPRTVAGAVPITRKLLQQTANSVEMMVRRDMIVGAALAIDHAGIQGSGVAGQPLGLINQTGINTAAIATDNAPTFAEVVSLETEIAVDNALMGSLAYLTTPALRGALKTTKKDAGSGIFVWENNEMNGYRAVSSTQVPSNGLYFGNWTDLMMGFWGVLDLKPDESTKAASGGLVLRVFQDTDIAVRHPESFCKGT